MKKFLALLLACLTLSVSANFVVKDGNGTSQTFSSQSINSVITPVHYLELGDNSPVTAFGEVSTSHLHQQVDLKFPYGVLSNQVTSTVTGSGTVTGASSMAVLSTTAATNSSAKIESKKVSRYTAGIGIVTRFTAMFTAGAANSTQYIGIGDDTQGFFVGYNGTSFGINRRSSSSDNFVAQASFNVDTLDGTGPSGMIIDKTKLNIFQIKYQYLGAGNVDFYVEEPNSKKYILFHRIKYAGANIAPSLENPTMPLYAKVVNTTNNTNIVLKTASMGAYSEGENEENGLRYAISNSKSGITTETNVITLKNPTTFNGVTNRTPVLVDYMSIATDGSGNNTIGVRAVINTTLGGSPSYTDISTNLSVMQYDTAGTTLTGGKLVLPTRVARNNQVREGLTGYGIILYPGDTFTVSASSATSVAVDVGLSWRELF